MSILALWGLARCCSRRRYAFDSERSEESLLGSRARERIGLPRYARNRLKELRHHRAQLLCCLYSMSLICTAQLLD